MPGGGLMQLVAYGAQDVFLTGTPQITFWNVNYKRNRFDFEAEPKVPYGINTYGRKYNNFEIKINKNSDDLDITVDMIFCQIINFNKLNENELFNNCPIIKKEKKKKEINLGGFGGLGRNDLF